MERDRQLLVHFLAALAYRTQKAVRDAPASYWELRAAEGSRTPRQILGHMTSLMGYLRALFVGGSYPREPQALADVGEEIERFHGMLEEVAALLEEEGRPLPTGPEQILQGPLADAMTHAGQLAFLRRLAASPVPPESFIRADIRSDRLGSDQPLPEAPDPDWPEAPGAAGRGGHPRFTGLAPRLPVADLARSRRFYEERLGFRATVLWPSVEPGFALLERDGARLGLFVGEGLAPGERSPELYVETTDARALHRRLEPDVTAEWGPEVYSYGRLEFAVRDPDGYLVIFTEPTDDPPTTEEPAY